VTQTDERPAAGSMEAEPGSFRDRDSRVIYRDGEVLRTLNARGLAEWQKLSATRFFPELLAAGRVVATEQIETHGELEEPWQSLLRHERIPFISYAYEWPFGMLKDAALLQLELMQRALSEDMLLKDATPYNVQWRGAEPVFIDIPSFVAAEPGEPWPGYKQFCELQLYPLFLQAYKGVPYHAFLRGSIDGIPAEVCRALMSTRDLVRPGVFVRVLLQSMLQSSHAQTTRDVKRDVKAAGFHKELIVANVKKLTKLVGKLKWKVKASEWGDYASSHSYDSENEQRKRAFVSAACSAKPRALIWDMGCNTGDYSRIASESGAYVVAMDGDQLAIERLYQALKHEGQRSILPLVINLADASPGLGWRARERKDLAARGTPDLTLCLALIHHMVISANVPMADFVDWIASLGSTDVVIEFVTKADEMVETLLRNKEDKYTDYDEAVLVRELERHFVIRKREVLKDAKRILFYAERA
jgi:hypothetical protein